MYPNFKKANTTDILRHLSNVNWLAMAENCKQADGRADAEMFSSEVSRVLDECIELYVPKVRRKARKPRYPKNIRTLAAQKNALHRSLRLDASLRGRYREVCRKYDDAVEAFFVEREHNVVNSGNVNDFYRYVNSKTKSRSPVPPLLKEDGTYAVDDLEKASLLNKYFVSVFTKDNGHTPNFAPKVPENVGLHSVAFSYDKVVKALRRLPSKCSRSPDGFPALFLKSIANEIAVPLAKLFEMTMQTGVLPEIWKTALVTPVYKKGHSSLCSNFRPISLTCVICKVAERIVADELLLYLRQRNLIASVQFGFLARRSTCTQLLSVLNEWTRAVNAKMRVDAVYIDFAKAFDSVCHAKLLKKLKGYGVNYELLGWISAFLSNRTQCVCVGDAMSDFAPVVSGVPQGSVLGPLLFLVYINDIVSCLEGSSGVVLFADDSKFYDARKGPDAANLVSTLRNFVGWASEWQLTVAFEKCNVFSVGKRYAPECRYEMGTTQIEPVSVIRDLGIQVSENLKPSVHCAYITAKAYSRCKLILKCFKTRNLFLLLRAYKTYVRPILESCTEVWNPYLLKDILCVERVQKYFTRMALFKCGVQYLEYAGRLKFLYLDSLELRRLKADLHMVFKIVHGLVDLRFDEFFAFDTSPYNLRGHAYKLKCSEKYNLECRKHFFSQRIVKVWNSLSTNVVHCTSLSSFKSRVDMCDFTRFCKIH